MFSYARNDTNSILRQIRYFIYFILIILSYTEAYANSCVLVDSAAPVKRDLLIITNGPVECDATLRSYRNAYMRTVLPPVSCAFNVNSV